MRFDFSEGVDSFIAAVDWVVDRETAEREQAEQSSDSEAQGFLDEARSQGWRP